mgnify:CR=1 FL=1
MVRKRPKVSTFRHNTVSGNPDYIFMRQEKMTNRRAKLPKLNAYILAYTEPLQPEISEALAVDSESAEINLSDDIKEIIKNLNHKTQIQMTIEAFNLFSVIISDIPDIKLSQYKKYVGLAKNWVNNKKKKSDVTAANKKLAEGKASGIQEVYNQSLYYLLEALYDKEHALTYLALSVELLAYILNQVGLVDFPDFITIWYSKINRILSTTPDTTKIKKLPKSE